MCRVCMGLCESTHEQAESDLLRHVVLHASLNQFLDQLNVRCIDRCSALTAAGRVGLVHVLGFLFGLETS